MSRNYENFVSAFFDYTTAAEVPELYRKWMAFSVIAAALERKVWLPNAGTVFYPNLYIMLIGDAGIRKSTAANMAVELARQVADIKFIPPRLNEASFRQALIGIGSKKHFIMDGTKYQHSAGYLYASEAATTFEDMYAGGGVVVPLTDCFNCEPLGWNLTHGWARVTIMHGDVPVLNPCVNLLACSTPEWFTEKVMNNSNARGGFGSRVLLVVQKGRPKRAFGWTEVTVNTHEMRLKLIEDLRIINKMQGCMVVGSDFKQLFMELDEKHETFLNNELVSPLVKSFYERKLTHSVKLSMVISASKRDTREVTAADLQEGWDMTESLEGDIMTAYAGKYGPTRDAITKEIVEHLKSKNIKRFTKAQIISRFSVKFPVRDVGAAIDDLVKNQMIKFSVEPGIKEITYISNLN